jgi:aspartyl-tRNA(Asn)/glutamyl-tRNA(Gln) amidotransferase subunit C
MKISREDVLRVAELAHLELSEAETETYLRQLDSILAYVDKLNELDTQGVEAMAHVMPPDAGSGSGTPLREDLEKPCNVVGEVLAGAPDATKTYFRVPKVIER